MKRPNAPDETAWCIHGRMHALFLGAPASSMPTRPMRRHLPGWQIRDQTDRPEHRAFYKRVAYDLGYEAWPIRNAEGNRLATFLGNHKTMMMGNHGVLIAAASVAEAFDELYYLSAPAER